MIWGETKRVKHFMIYRNLRDHSNRQWLSENNEWINKFCIQFFFFKIIRIFYIKVFEISQSSGLTFIWENVRKRRWIKIPDTDNLQVVTCMYLCLVFQKNRIKHIMNTVEHFVNVLICSGRYYVFLYHINLVDLWNRLFLSVVMNISFTLKSAYT